MYQKSTKTCVCNYIFIHTDRVRYTNRYNYTLYICMTHMFLLIYVYCRCRYTKCVCTPVFHVHTKLLLHSIYSKWLNKLFGKTKDPDTNVLFCKLNNWRSTTLFPSQITCLWPPPKNTDPMCRWGRHASEKTYGHGGSWLVVSCGRTSHPLGCVALINVDGGNSSDLP